MKQGELRIGSLIQWDDDSNEIVEVKGVWFDEEINNWMVEFTDGVAMIDEFIGVAITEEWLSRMGFIKEKVSSIGGCDMWSGMGAWSHGENKWLLRGNPRTLHLSGHFNTQVICIHQLQCLFYALKGVELNITI
jgi:hypothetical protein